MRFERWRNIVSLRWRSLVRRRAVERDLDDEIRDHLESQIEALVARGVPPRRRRARRARAIRRARSRERAVPRRLAHAAASSAWCRTCATRRARCGTAPASPRSPSSRSRSASARTRRSSASSTASSSRACPIPAPIVSSASPGTYPGGAFAAMRDEVRTMDVAAYAEGHRFTLSGRGQPASITGARVSAEFFSILGVEPALGRWPRPREDHAPGDRIVVLSHGLWRRHFGGDPAVVGRSIDVDGIAREVVAVMPATFTFPSSRTQAVGAARRSTRATRRATGPATSCRSSGACVRGASLAQAHAEMRAAPAAHRRAVPVARCRRAWNRDVAVVPLHSAVVGDVRPRLLMLLAGGRRWSSSIACANVANLPCRAPRHGSAKSASAPRMGAAPHRSRASCSPSASLLVDARRRRSACCSRPQGLAAAEARAAGGHAAPGRSRTQLARAGLHRRPRRR